MTIISNCLWRTTTSSTIYTQHRQSFDFSPQSLTQKKFESCEIIIQYTCLLVSVWFTYSRTHGGYPFVLDTIQSYRMMLAIYFSPIFELDGTWISIKSEKRQVWCGTVDWILIMLLLKHNQSLKIWRLINDRKNGAMTSCRTCGDGNYQ